MMKKITWLAQRNIYRRGVELLACVHDGVIRSYGLPVSIEMKFIEGDEYVVPEPTLFIRHEEAQQLLQALWDAGVRPANHSSPDGEINALRNHVRFAESVATSLLPQSK